MKNSFPGSSRILLFTMTFLLTGIAAVAQTYSIGNVNMTFTDSSRGNRAVEAEIFYPADQTGYNVPVALPLEKKFPVIVFGHAQEVGWNNYQYLWDFFVPRGFMVVLPKTEMTATPDHDAFAKDLAFVVNEFSRMRWQQGSLFYKKYNGKSCVTGHGMGGGAATLAAMYNPSITTLVTLAASETAPSAVSAAQNVEMPALVFSGAQDCVAPAASNQLLIYNNLASVCKAYISLNNSTHCNFAQNSGSCTANEILCNGTVPAYQLTNILTNYISVSWMRYFLKYNANAFAKFEWKLAQKSPQISYSYTCSGGQPREGVLTAEGDDDDADLVLSEMHAEVFPNPVLSGNSIQLDIHSDQPEDAQVTLTDLTGRTVLNRMVSLQPAETNRFEVSTRDIRPGYYMMILTAGSRKISRPLVIE